MPTCFAPRKKSWGLLGRRYGTTSEPGWTLEKRSLQPIVTGSHCHRHSCNSVVIKLTSPLLLPFRPRDSSTYINTNCKLCNYRWCYQDPWQTGRWLVAWWTEWYCWHLPSNICTRNGLTALPVLMEERLYVTEAYVIQLQNYASQSNWTLFDFVSALGEMCIICGWSLLSAFISLKLGICPVHKH